MKSFAKKGKVSKIERGNSICDKWSIPTGWGALFSLVTSGSVCVESVQKAIACVRSLLCCTSVAVLEAMTESPEAKTGASASESTADRDQFEIELEFVQCLANPTYLNCTSNSGGSRHFCCDARRN